MFLIDTLFLLTGKTVLNNGKFWTLFTAWKPKTEKISQRYTTDWRELVVVK